MSFTYYIWSLLFRKQLLTAGGALAPTHLYCVQNEKKKQKVFSTSSTKTPAWKIMKCCASAMVDKQPESNSCPCIVCKITELTALTVELTGFMLMCSVALPVIQRWFLSNLLAVLALSLIFHFGNSSLDLMASILLGAHAQPCACRGTSTIPFVGFQKKKKGKKDCAHCTHLYVCTCGRCELMIGEGTPMLNTRLVFPALSLSLNLIYIRQFQQWVLNQFLVQMNRFHAHTLIPVEG